MSHVPLISQRTYLTKVWETQAYLLYGEDACVGMIRPRRIDDSWWTLKIKAMPFFNDWSGWSKSIESFSVHRSTRGDDMLILTGGEESNATFLEYRGYLMEKINII